MKTTSGRSISRILSGEFPHLCDHLSGRRVAAPLDATYPGLAFLSHKKARMKTSRLPPSADGFVPTWSCSRRGLPGHPHYCRCRWSLTPPFHHDYPRVAVCFCGPLPAGFAPPRMLSDAVLYGVRTFLGPDNAGPRSPNRPEAISSYTYGGRASTRIDSLENKSNIGKSGKRH